MAQPAETRPPASVEAMRVNEPSAERESKVEVEGSNETLADELLKKSRPAKVPTRPTVPMRSKSTRGGVSAQKTTLLRRARAAMQYQRGRMGNLASLHNRRKSLGCTLASSPNYFWLIRCDVGQAVTIDVLPDDILLAIFDFCVVRYQDLDIHEVALGNKDTKRKIESWQTLVHVCRRWRCTVFASPRRLNLQLRWRPRTSVRKTLNIWPAFPLLIAGDISGTPMDDVIAELEHNDRICQITLYFDTTLQIEKLWTAMQVPFPELATLYLSFGGVSFVPVLPDSFLGGSAPRLQYLSAPCHNSALIHANGRLRRVRSKVAGKR
jgi:hypothetical protein